MIFLMFIVLFFGFSNAAIWNIPKEYATNSSWCYPKGGKWDVELKQCICYKNYYGSFCEKIKNCRYGSKINHECLCLYGWKGDACDLIDCKFGIALDNKTCACNSGIGGIYCDSCLERYRSPPNCFNPNDRINETPIPKCSTNIINYYLNIFLFLLIVIYFTINRYFKRREMLRPVLTPEMEALLLAKTHISPDFTPCPRYEDALSHSRPTSVQYSAIPPLLQDEESMITVMNNEMSLPPSNQNHVRIISLHV